MANYYASARSNYFKVKNPDAFFEAMKPFDLDISDRNADDALCLLCKNDGGWSWYNSDTEKDHNPVDIIAPHLQDNEVCILMETGAEKLRYLIGYAVAFNNKKRQTVLSLQNIYDIARKEFGEQASITEATY